MRLTGRHLGGGRFGRGTLDETILCGGLSCGVKGPVFNEKSKKSHERPEKRAQTVV